MSLHYTDSGKGNPALVFLHYFGGSSGSWNDVIVHLQNEFRCIAIDLFGFGKSSTTQSQITVEESSEKVLELIEKLLPGNYVLIAHSMGAKIAVNIAAKPLKGLQSLILIAPSPPSPEPMEEADRKNMYDAFGKRENIENMLKNALGSAISNDVFEREINNNLSVSEGAWKSWTEIGSKEDISSQMQHVHVSVAILYGENDKRFTKKYLDKEYSQYFKTFPLTEIQNTGHLVPVESPQETAIEIRKLIS